MTDLKVGQGVQTVNGWSGIVKLTGTVKRIAGRGPNPVNPERRVLVVLDEQFGEFRSLWFDPADLEGIDMNLVVAKMIDRGHVEVAGEDKSGEPTYHLTPAGIEYVEKMLGIQKNEEK